MQNIIIIFGGKSVEHEISIITGVLALNSTDKEKYNIIPVYITRSGDWLTGEELFNIESYKNMENLKLDSVTLISGNDILYLIRGKKLKPLAKIDCVLNCCHGASGEDGSLSGLIRLCNIAFASPDVCGSGVAMDKSVSKLVAKAISVKAVPALKICKTDYEKRKRIADKYITETIGFPVIIKPSRLGSSIGISTANCQQSLEKALDMAFLYDDIILVERLLKNKKEINCAAYSDGEDIIVSECEQPPLKTDFLTFEDKYLRNDKEGRKIPADIDKKMSSRIKIITKQLYKRLNLKGIVRIDFLIEGDEVYFNELNTVPGSLAYYMFCNDIKEMGGLIDILITAGIKFKQQEEKLLTDFTGEVLSKMAKNGSKCLKKR
jgi:D-alanine-D-alanine ligase